MASLSNSLINSTLDHLFGSDTYTKPATIYVALSSTTFDSTTGTGFTELTDSTYTRATVTNNTANFPAATGKAKANGTQITFPSLTAASTTVVAWAIYDAATAGNYLAGGSLTTSQTVNAGNPIYFDIGDLTFTMA